MSHRNSGARSAFARRQWIVVAVAVWIAFVLLAPVAISQSPFSPGRAKDPGVRPGGPDAGDPLPGLTPGQLAAFHGGKDAFEEVNVVADPPPGADPGLGPGFNSDSCESCHAQPATGGTSPAVNPQIAVATKLNARNSIPWFISQNGPVREVRFVRKPDGSPDGGVHNLFVISGRDDARGCDIRQEDFSNRSNLRFRIPTPTFGLGLVEAIPDRALLRNLRETASQRARMGIGGRFNTNDNDGTITRFGWKAQVKSLVIFSGEAYNVEQGVSNPLFPQERDESPECSYNSTPEDASDFDAGEMDDITMFAAFMRFLAPPARGPADRSVAEGENVFSAIGCNLCHTPALRTENNTIEPLRNKIVPLFSDLAVHRMGSGLADNISLGGARGDEFRTAPLWGLGKRIFFLHDGRTSDLAEAIEAHAGQGSEANGVIRNYDRLSGQAKQSLLNFLRSL